MSIHRIETIKETKIKEETHEGRTYYVKDISIKTEKGERIELMLFSEKKEGLITKTTTR